MLKPDQLLTVHIKNIYNLEFGFILKEMESKKNINRIFENYLESNYNNYISIFTDGSKTENNISTGYAWICAELGIAESNSLAKHVFTSLVGHWM